MGVATDRRLSDALFNTMKRKEMKNLLFPVETDFLVLETSPIRKVLCFSKTFPYVEKELSKTVVYRGRKKLFVCPSEWDREMKRTRLYSTKNLLSMR